MENGWSGLQLFQRFLYFFLCVMIALLQGKLRAAFENVDRLLAEVELPEVREPCFSHSSLRSCRDTIDFSWPIGSISVFG
jgi:hypothetical protein